MILECRINGKWADRVTIEGEDSITYDTRAAQSTVETHIESVGYRKALRDLRSWSNGYITLTEIAS